MEDPIPRRPEARMPRLPLLLTLLLLLCPAALSGQALAGDWVYQGPAGTVRLSLQQEGTTLRGTMIGGDGTRFAVQGVIEDGRATGQLQVGGGAGWFMLGFVDQGLKMVVAEINAATGQPDLNSGWELDFTRVGAAVGAGAGGQGGLGGVSGGTAGGVGQGGGVGGGVGQGGAADAGVGGVPPQSEATPLLREWLGHLRGKRLSYRESYNSNDARGFGGYSNRWDAFLCSDGTFFFQQRSRMNIDTGGVIGSGGGDNVARGIWRIVEANGAVYLQYRMEGEEGAQGMLRHENGSTYIDRDRIFVTEENPHCR
jgi:hypothetical protein